LQPEGLSPLHVAISEGKGAAVAGILLGIEDILLLGTLLAQPTVSARARVPLTS
jgi:hypothetical protein